MSITYNLEIEKQIEPRELIRIVANLTDMSHTHNNELVDKDSGLVIGAYKFDSEYAGLTKEEFGFYPTTELTFFHNKVKHDQNNQLMMSVLVSLLTKIDGDLVLQYIDGPSAVFTRMDGVITADPDWKGDPDFELFDKHGIRYKLQKLRIR